ncbi:hypothetical protein AAMO2058_000063000 [Amorphochlora amoebiformis]
MLRYLLPSVFGAPPEEEKKEQKIGERMIGFGDFISKTVAEVKGFADLELPNIDDEVHTLAKYSALVSRVIQRYIHSTAEQKKRNPLRPKLRIIRQAYVNPRLLQRAKLMLENLQSQIRVLKELIDTREAGESLNVAVREHIGRIKLDTDEHLKAIQAIKTLEDSYFKTLAKEAINFSSLKAYRQVVDYMYPTPERAKDEKVIDKTTSIALEAPLAEIQCAIDAFDSRLGPWIDREKAKAEKKASGEGAGAANHKDEKKDGEWVA